MRTAIVLALSLLVAACLPGPGQVNGPTRHDGGGDAGPVADGGSNQDGGSCQGAASVTCQACVTSADCGSCGACVQYGADDHCGNFCTTSADCASNELCAPLVAFDGTQVMVCAPTNGSCGGSTGCGTCPSGTTCDTTTGTCQPIPDGGTNPAPDGGSCGTYVPPTSSSCCSSCTPGSSNCQANGCYGGWWCDSSTCKCHSPPTSCGSTDGGSGAPDAGSTADAGSTTDAGSTADAGSSGADAGSGGADAGVPSGTVGPSGGTVSSLYFAVIGDTRPANEDDTANYPTAIITQIYKDIDALNPKPEFAVATGDYQFANPSGSQGQAQLDLYAGARANFTGQLFPTMGNHECTGATAGNCAGTSSNNLTAFKNTLLAPINQTNPWYRIDVNAVDGSWTSKFLFVACNDWDSTQQSWLQGELGQSTTYTFVVRHEPRNNGTAPCANTVDAMLTSSNTTLLLVGHTHTYSTYGNQVLVGTGGAPLTSSTYGWATIQQVSAGWKVTQYDSTNGTVVSTTTIP